MNELTTRESTEIAVLGNLAQEAQFYARSIANGMIQLGRVLTEAKSLVKHGEWEHWIAENAGCSVRYAQMFMQAYERFGDNPAVMQIEERGKIFKLLALPSGTEEKFLDENDVADMSTREVEEAVRRVREEMGVELAKERKARKLAEERAEELKLKEGTMPQEAIDVLIAKENTIAEQQRELTRITDDGRAALQEAQRLRRENASLTREIEEQNQLIEEAQEQYDKVRGDLLALQSAAAKGDAERVPADELTINVFASAVRQFIGTCARMPHMGPTFGTMLLSEKNAYDELLRTIEGWAQSARKAMNTIAYEEVEIHG